MNLPAQDASLIFDVTDVDFEQKVLARSIDVPVLVDCWAPWCGPCKSLTPVLEKLAREYNGRFLLAKVNVDESPQVANAMRARSIPMVMLFVAGRPVEQFVGALPEGQVREFLDRHLGPADAAEGEPLPGPLDEAELLIEEGALEEARALLESLPAEMHDERHAKLLTRIRLASEKPEGDPRALAARIAANPKDFEARFQLAALHVFAGDFKSAFDELLEVVMRDRNATPEGWREKARKQLVEWFEVCPDPEVVSHGRRYLGMYLN